MYLRVSVVVISFPYALPQSLNLAISQFFVSLVSIFCLHWLLAFSLDVINFMLRFCRGLDKYLVSPGKKVVSEVHYSLTESTGNMRA